MKYLYILILTLFISTGQKTPLGKFHCIFGYDHYNLTLKKDSTFEQKNGSCTWTYLAKGRWKVKADTIQLIAEKVYDVHGGRRKELITDTCSFLYRLYKTMNEVVIKQDTLGILKKSDGQVYCTRFKLVKEK